MASKFMVKADISKEVYKAMSDIGRYDTITQDNIRRVVREKTNEVYKLAVQLAPMNKGKLKSKIKAIINNTDKGTQGIVQVNDPVAHLIEFGVQRSIEIPVRKKALHPGADGWFMAHAVIPFRAAKPFMKPAMDTIRPTIESAVKEAISNGNHTI